MTIQDNKEIENDTLTNRQYTHQKNHTKKYRNPYLRQITQRLQASLETTTNKPEDLSDAAVLITITNEAYPKVLLTRRAAHMNSHAGEVSFVGGKRDEGDFNDIATALREAEEETGLLPSYVDIVGQLDVQISKSGLTVRPIVAIIDANITLRAEPEEIARIFWVDLAWFIKTPTVDYQLLTTFGEKEVKLVTPSWQVDDEVIWGLTGRIIANMLAVVFDKQVEWYYRPTT